MTRRSTRRRKQRGVGELCVSHPNMTEEQNAVREDHDIR